MVAILVVALYSTPSHIQKYTFLLNIYRIYIQMKISYQKIFKNVRSSTYKKKVCMKICMNANIMKRHFFHIRIYCTYNFKGIVLSGFVIFLLWGLLLMLLLFWTTFVLVFF